MLGESEKKGKSIGRIGKEREMENVLVEDAGCCSQTVRNVALKWKTTGGAPGSTTTACAIFFIR